MKTRESNLELLRIISIIMIIFYHFIYHTNTLVESTNSLNVVSNILVALIIIHVNIFILISGYFGYKSKFKISKLLSINNAMWFYTIIFTVIGLLFLDVSITKLDIFKNFLPIDFNRYWFITTYLLLYLLMPILNIFINNSSKKKHLIVLIFLFITFSIIPTLTNGEVFNVVKGYSLYHFIFIYLLGAYLGKYKSSFKTNYLLIIYFICAILNIVNHYLSCSIVGNPNSLINYIGISLGESFLSYANPLIIIQAVAFFLLFTKLKIKSPIINTIASCVLGIYLIHDNPILRAQYSNMPLSNNLTTLLIGVLFTIIVFISCLIIELLRKQLFKFIYNLKISKSLRPKYTKYFNKIEKYVNE